MKINGLRKLRSSLFLKILIIFSLALFVTITVLLITQRFFFHPKRFPGIPKIAESHARYITKDLGDPPNISKAQKLAKNLRIQIRIKTPDLNWASHKGMIDFSNLNTVNYDNEARTYTGFLKQGFCVAFQQNNIEYILIMQPKKEVFRYVAGLFVITIISFTTFLIIGMYFVIQWLLKPIKVLGEGVKQISKGNINYKMISKRSDELGQLIGSFNTMTQRINQMIQAKEQLLLDVSHELRSPITRIKLALEFIKDKDAKKNIRDDISELEIKITELLETERLDSQHGKLKLKKTKIFQLLLEVCADFQNQKPGINMMSFPENSYLNLDPERIKILFRNIIDNAIQYSDPKGYPVEISLREKADEFTIAIKDFGKGVPKKDLPFLFEPFYRVDKSRSKKTGGYGLGMSLSKKIMEAHGGTIEIASRLKVGTTVFLKFKK